jgi:hypothetical protein
MKKQFNLIAAAVISSFAASTAQAIQFDGFMTAGASKIVAIEDADKGNIYIGGLGDRGVTEDLTFEKDTRFGLQISSDVSDNMSVVAQILGRGDAGNFNAVVEWAYIDYEVHDVASIHVGKIKQPVYLVNDYVEVGYAYPWIRPPQEVYLLNNPLNTVNGIELLVQLPLGPGTLSLQPYLGSNRDDIPNGGGAYFEAENIYGLDIKYSGRGYAAHASNFQCDVTVTGSSFTQSAALLDGLFGQQDSQVQVNLGGGEGKCNVTAAGFNLDIANFVAYAEWTKRTTDQTLSQPFGDTEAYYATIGYRIGKWLPHLTFASITGEASTVGLATGQGAAVPIDSSTGQPFAAPDPRAGITFNFPVPIQTSITAGVRYEVNDSAALKIEYQVVDVEQDPTELQSSNQQFNYGLFNTNFDQLGPQDKVGIMSVAMDVIF